MKFSKTELEQKAAEAIRASLEDVPSVKIKGIETGPDFKGYRADLVTTVSTPTGTTRFLVAEIKATGEPRVAREALNRLWRNWANQPDVVPLFIAPYISPKSAEICKQDNAGYVDLAGNCRLVLENVFVEREGRPNPFSEKRDLQSVYSPKASRVVRVLLANPGMAWKVQDLSGEAEVSLGLVANVKKCLEDREWIRKTEKGLVLREPEKLLAEWAENYSFRKNATRDFFSLKAVADLEVDLGNVCVENKRRYALTGFSASARLAPAVRSPRMMAYVENLSNEIIVPLGLKEVTSGANVTLLEPYDAGVFYGAKEIDGVCVASPVQVYLDLRGYRGRGEEAAVKLLDEVIRPRW
ncbi:MAG: type IV toxin-antitoxin system AbiEi family antitoxin [Syntrophales bacterium]